MRLKDEGIGSEDIISMLEGMLDFKSLGYHEEGENKVVLVGETNKQKLAIAYGKDFDPEQYLQEARNLEDLSLKAPSYFPEFFNYIEIDPRKGVVSDLNRDIQQSETEKVISMIFMSFLEDFDHIDRVIEHETTAFGKIELEKMVAGLEGYAVGYVLGATGRYTADPNSGNLLLKDSRKSMLKYNEKIYESEDVIESVGQGRLSLKFVDVAHFNKIKDEEIFRLVTNKDLKPLEDVFLDKTYGRREIAYDENLNIWRLNLLAGFDHGSMYMQPIK